MPWAQALFTLPPLVPEGTARRACHRAPGYPARDLAGLRAVRHWTHRYSAPTDPANQVAGFCFIAGGYDGAAYRSDAYRYWTP